MRSIFRPVLAILAATLWAVAPSALAQAYPSKPIKAIVYGAPGSTPDLFARAVSKLMSASMGQPIVIDNRAGAGGILATQELLKASPDGYTILFTSSTLLVNQMLMMKNPPFDSQRDLTPIGATFSPVVVLLVRADLPAKTVPELVALAKATPGKLSYGASAVGTILHLDGEQFAALSDTKLLHVSYKSPVAAIQDVAAGNVDMSFTSSAGLSGVVGMGKARVLAVMEKQRYKGLPDVPTVAESLPAYEKVDSWFALMGPAKLPPAIVTRLNAELNKALRSPEMARWMDESAAQPIGGTPAQVTDMMKSGTVRMKKLIDRIGLQPE